MSQKIRAVPAFVLASLLAAPALAQEAPPAEAPPPTVAPPPPAPGSIAPEAASASPPAVEGSAALPPPFPGSVATPPAAPEASAPPPPPPPPPPATEMAGEGCCATKLRPFGYIRTLFSSISEDGESPDHVGRNDGFQMAHARLGIEATRNHTRAHLSIEGAVDKRHERNTSTGDVEVALRDAFVEYKPCTGFKAAVGQFEVPFDAEELTSNTELVFVDQGVESRGIQGVEGNNLDGLSLERQVGLLLSSDPIYLMEKGFGVTYALALTNGSSASHPINDNDSLAYTGRVELLWDELVTLGVAMNWNKVSSGEVPDRLMTKQTSMAADLQVNFMGAHVLGQVMRRTSTPEDVENDPETIAQGFHVQGAYDAPFGLTPGYRFAMYDKTAEAQVEDAKLARAFEIDDVKVHTLGLSWAVPDEPLTLKVNYHLMQENSDAAATYGNNRLDVLVQGVF